MEDEITYPVNDTNRSIGAIIDGLKSFESPWCDERVKAIILTNLEQAQLWSLKLIKEINVS